MAGTQAAGPTNTDLRVLLLGSARPSSQMVTPPQAYSPGNLLSLNLPATGLARYARVTAAIPITCTATNTPRHSISLPTKPIGRAPATVCRRNCTCSTER